MRISQTTGQMRLSCRRRSVTDSEDVLNKGVEAPADDDEEENYDEGVPQDVKCKRRMALVVD